MFICAHCPFVKHIEKELGEARQGLRRPVAGHRGHQLERRHDSSRRQPRRDSSSRLRPSASTSPISTTRRKPAAHAYKAACTPDFYLFDADFSLVYRGQFDSSRPGNGIPVTGQDLRAAIDTALAGKPVPADQHPSIGCNIKWKA